MLKLGIQNYDKLVDLFDSAIIFIIWIW